MNFIALDLETTGLSPETDTIIEIAAIRFTIDTEGGFFVMRDPEERSMLIHPGRLLEQEVTMITGITSDMLIGKPSFDSVRDRVHDFIGDAIIVGHNVLFDIAMFTSHGIDLSSNKVIDTFELSEIFSQDIESLNLGFLANRYGLINPDEAEHRALTDTKVSIRLFLKYLGEIRNLTGKKKQIWNRMLTKDESQTLKTLGLICHPVGDTVGDISTIFGDLLGTQKKYPSNECSSKKIINSTYNNKIVIDTHGNIEEEITLIKNAFTSHSHINLIVPGYKVATWMSQVLSEKEIENTIAIPINKWCSVAYTRELLMSSENFPRKKMILILKLAFWMTETETGLIDELKFYGDERNMIEIFRSNEQDISIWREEYEQKIKEIPILISDAYNLKIENKDSSRYIIIKDIPLLEDIVRRVKSQEISFDRLYESIQSLICDGIFLEKKIHIADMISMIRGIYESIPNRPTGPLVSPPGSYGETYFITQAILWHQGHKWLVHATRTLDQSWKTWKEGNSLPLSRNTNIAVDYIEKSIQTLIQYHTYIETNINITLNISDEKTKITFIPRSVKTILEPLLNGALAYGTNISLPQTEIFLEQEYGYMNNELLSKVVEKIPRKIIIPAEYHPGIVKPGTIILTTSQKHARDIGQALRKIHGKNTEVLIQGLSGGKGKMLSIFENKIEQTILVGLIDTWRDEYSLWKNARYIIIAKLPFDPPTDSYFLARTVGMCNNFSEYSEPIVTIRLNTLIERILSSGYTGKIIITDSRLIDTEWGKRINAELL